MRRKRRSGGKFRSERRRGIQTGCVATLAAPIQLSFSNSQIAPGNPVTLSWNVFPALSTTQQQCYAFVQGGATGREHGPGSRSARCRPQPIPVRRSITPTANGTYTYALTCGGTESGFATLTVSLRHADSYSHRDSTATPARHCNHYRNRDSPHCHSYATATATATATPTATGHCDCHVNCDGKCDSHGDRHCHADCDSYPTPTATPTTSMTVTASLPFGNVADGQTVTKNLTVHNTGKTNSLVISSATRPTLNMPSAVPGRAARFRSRSRPRHRAHSELRSRRMRPACTPASLATLSDNAATSPQHVSLTSTGIVDLTTSKSSLVFGDVKFGARAPSHSAVTNHQTQPVGLSESLSDANASDFSMGGTCTGTLAAKTACTTTVTFVPGALGAESATLTISDSPDPLSPYMVALTTGPTIPATISPVTLAYGTLTARTSPKTKDVTVTNKSDFPCPSARASSAARIRRLYGDRRHLRHDGVGQLDHAR